jgi:hypothetical protein
MMDYIHLSATTPHGESCAQVGNDHYMQNAKLEAHAYINQLRRTLGENPVGSRFAITKCPHDFGTYLDIKFFYDDEDQRHVIYMSQVEMGCEKWDEIASSELSKDGYALENSDSISNEEEISDETWEEYSTHDNGPTGHGDDCFSDVDPGL